MWAEAAGLFEVSQRLIEFVHCEGRKPQQNHVEDHGPRPRHQGPPDGDRLLLPARHRRARLRLALAEYELGLAVGKSASAIIKSSDVMVGVD